MANEAPDIDLNKLFREKRKQSKEFKGKDKIPSNDDFKFYEQYLPLYNEGGDARRSIPNLSRFEKIRKMITENGEILVGFKKQDRGLGGFDKERRSKWIANGIANEVEEN